MTEEQAHQKLSVWHTVGQSYRFVFSHLKRFLALAYFPIVLTFSFHVALLIARIKISGFHWLYLLALQIVFLAIFSTIFAVSWHRFVLLGRESQVPIYLRFGKREIRYAGLLSLYLLPLIFLIVSITIFTPNLVLLAIVVFCLLLCPIFFVRLVFMFPAIALEKQFSINQIWRYTKKRTLRLLLAMTVIILFNVFLNAVFLWLIFKNPYSYLYIFPLGIVLYYLLFVAIIVTIVSLSYKQIADSSKQSVPKNLISEPNEVIKLKFDRDLGWLFMCLSLFSGLYIPWLVFEIYKWKGVLAASPLILAFLRVPIWLCLSLIEDTSLILNTNSLCFCSRFDEIIFYLKDIKNVSVRSVFGSRRILLTFFDIDQALGHKFLIYKQTPPRIYKILWNVYKCMTSIDVLSYLIKIFKGDFALSFLGQKVDIYKEGDEQFYKDLFFSNFEKHKFHFIVPAIFRTKLSVIDLARVIDTRCKLAMEKDKLPNTT